MNATGETEMDNRTYRDKKNGETKRRARNLKQNVMKETVARRREKDGKAPERGAGCVRRKLET